MFALCCDIKIGSVSFKSVHDVRIKRSLYDLAATAVIKVPVTAVLKHAGEPPTHIETAQAVKAGDPVEIKLGYDGSLNTEFKGYVKRLNYKVPLGDLRDADGSAGLRIRFLFRTEYRSPGKFHGPHTGGGGYAAGGPGGL